MDAYLLDWASLLLRWAHVVTAIAWIGASFYFVFLDNSLTPPSDPELLKLTTWPGTAAPAASLTVALTVAAAADVTVVVEIDISNVAELVAPVPPPPAVPPPPNDDVPSLPPPPPQATRANETNHTNVYLSIFIVKLTLFVARCRWGQRTAVLSDTTFGVRKISNSVFVEALVFVLNR